MRRRRRSRSSRFSDQLIALFFMLLLTFAVGYLSRFLSEPVAGPFRAQDGDSLLSASGQSLRLEGVDAPEYRQMCDSGDVSYPCGREAAAQLRRLVRGAGVECDGYGFDPYERILVRCRKGDTDINEKMVSGGWAVAYGDYYSAEAEAREAKRGIWVGSFDRPQEWREIHGLAGEVEPIGGWLRRTFRLIRSLAGFD